MKKIIKILQFVIPVVLLLIIILKIDFVKLANVFVSSNIPLLLLTFLSFPLSYIIFTLRWKLVLNMFGKKNVPFSVLFKIIYKGLFVGFFVPASLGLDIYRVLELKNTNTNHINIGLIFQEKLMGLLVCGFMILLFSSYLGIELGSTFFYIRDGLYIMVGITLAIVVLLLIFKKNRNVQLLLNYFEKKLILLLNYFTQKFKRKIQIEEGFINKVLNITLLPKMIIVVVLFGVLNQSVGAIFSNIAFNALGADIDLAYNLFANPLLNIIFLFPISFGGFGIREGSYILIFGILGIAPEISLLVSFIFMVSTFINIGIGGIIFMLDKKKSNV